MKSAISRMIVALAVLALALGLAACGGGDDTTSGSETAAESTTAEGGGGGGEEAEETEEAESFRWWRWQTQSGQVGGQRRDSGAGAFDQACS